MLVSQILSTKPDAAVVTIRPDATVGEAAALLSEKRIGAVVVSEDGKVPAGILSERDIVRELGQRAEGCLNDKVSALMTAELTTCTPRDSARDVLTWMTEGRFRHMPVMEGATMIGIISIGDVVKARLGELRMERDALHGMITGG